MSRDVEALIADLRALHKGEVLNVHAGTHHSKGRRRLFSACSCGWMSGPRVIEDDYDGTVPLPCPTVVLLDKFTAQKPSQPTTTDGRYESGDGRG